MFRHSFSVYNRLLVKHPIIVNSISCCVISCAGDALAQGITYYSSRKYGKAFSFNKKRFLKFGAFGLVFCGFPLFQFYKFIDGVKILTRGRNKFTIALKKNLASQILFSPVSVAFYLVFVSTELSKLHQFQFVKWKRRVTRKFRSEYLRTFLNNMKLWIPGNMVIFLLPFNYRTVATSLLSIGWFTYLSLVGFREMKKGDETEV